MEEICGKAINVQEVLVQIIAVKAGSIPSPKHLDFRSTPELTPMMGDCHVLCTCWPKTYVVLFAPTPTFNFQPFSKTKRLGVISRLRWGSYSTSSTFRCSHDWVPKTKALVQSLVLAATSRYSSAPAGWCVCVCVCLNGHGFQLGYQTKMLLLSFLAVNR